MTKSEFLLFIASGGTLDLTQVNPASYFIRSVNHNQAYLQASTWI